MWPNCLWRHMNHHSPAEAQPVLQRPLLRWGQDQLKTTRGGRNAIQLTRPGSGQDKHTVLPSQLQESKAKWQSSEPWKQQQKEEVRLDLE